MGPPPAPNTTPSDVQGSFLTGLEAPEQRRSPRPRQRVVRLASRLLDALDLLGLRWLVQLLGLVDLAGLLCLLGSSVQRHLLDALIGGLDAFLHRAQALIAELLRQLA